MYMYLVCFRTRDGWVSFTHDSRAHQTQFSPESTIPAPWRWMLAFRRGAGFVDTWLTLDRQDKSTLPSSNWTMFEAQGLFH